MSLGFFVIGAILLLLFGLAIGFFVATLKEKRIIKNLPKNPEALIEPKKINITERRNEENAEKENRNEREERDEGNEAEASTTNADDSQSQQRTTNNERRDIQELDGSKSSKPRRKVRFFLKPSRNSRGK